MKGFFGNLFDFNGDGKLGAFERAAEFTMLAQIMDETEETLGFSSEDEEEYELEINGLDRDELECMDEDERREALEDAGLDPDDYDFD